MVVTLAMQLLLGTYTVVVTLGVQLVSGLTSPESLPGVPEAVAEGAVAGALKVEALSSGAGAT